MRPHKLVLTAFGPFSKETTVDFDAMGNNIYLISGDTGAGKTTIFDGMIYALYGTASGDGRSKLNTESFHSDYAKDGKHRDEMKVEFTFSNNGRTFTVSRRMYWGVRGDAQKATKESVLRENGNTIVHGKGVEEKDEVTEKITELLGLDADQFRRIIMLAQGEFRKFLEAGSDKRGEILGKLYDNRKHQDLQYRLKAARYLLDHRSKEMTDEITARLNLFHLPDEITEEEREMLQPDHPQLLLMVSELTGRLEAGAALLNEDLDKENEKQKQRNARKAKAESDNHLLDQLTDQKEKKKLLEAEKQEKDLLRGKVSLAQQAEKVIPAENNLTAANKALQDQSALIGRLEKEQVLLKRDAVLLTERAQKTEADNTPEILRLQGSQTEIRKILPLYDDLADSLQILGKKKQHKELADQKLTAAKAAHANLEEKQKKLEETLNLLDSAGEASVLNAANQLENCSTRRGKLEGLKNDITVVQTLLSECRNAAAAWEKASKSYQDAREKHRKLYDAFVQGQACVLAKDMLGKLEEMEKQGKPGQVRCPVCGSFHTIADAADFAYDDVIKVPARKAVDDAGKAEDQASSLEKTAIEAYNSAKALCDAKKSAAEKLAGELIGKDQWTDISDGKAVNEAISLSLQQEEAAKKLFEKARKDLKEKQDAKKQKEKTEAQLLTSEADLNTAKENCNTCISELAVARNDADNCKKQLEGYPQSREAAEKQLEKEARQVRLLQKQIDDSRTAKMDHEKKLAKNKGNLESALSEKIQREEKLSQQKQNFENTLEKQHFSGKEEYHLALTPAGRLLDMDGIAAWISKEQDILQKYDRTVADTEATIKNLEELTQGLEYTQLNELNAAIRQADQKIENLQKQAGKITAQAADNRTIGQSLIDITKQQNRCRKALKEIAPMADTANGSYAFSRYVLNDFFHRIVEQANIHLAAMTDGEYSLEPNNTQDGRKLQGLGLAVVNTITGTERATATLSGGQSFEASLALALGLSDVVQMESSSAIQIDSMFIDEGFGSLDGSRLDKAIEVLHHLSGGKRQVGIISHVARLEECLPKKIHVIAGSSGSRVEIETDE